MLTIKRQWYICLSKSKPDLSDVLPAWRTDYKAFAEAMYCLGWSPGYSIERISEDGDLEPGNIHFVPMSSTVRVRRRRNTKYVSSFGVVAPLAWFIESHPLCEVRDYHVVYGRIATGWSPEYAMTKPTTGRIKPQHCKYSPSTIVDYNGVEMKIAEITSSSGVKTKEIVKRLNLGWPLDQAVETPLNGIRPTRNCAMSLDT